MGIGVGADHEVSLSPLLLSLLLLNTVFLPLPRWGILKLYEEG